MIYQFCLFFIQTYLIHEKIFLQNGKLIIENIYMYMYHNLQII